MTDYRPLLSDLLAPGRELCRDDLIFLLSLADETSQKRLFEAAYRVKLGAIGNRVHFRGLIEFSNVCTKNCHYCGIRRGNRSLQRYTMTLEEIAQAARWVHESGYGSVVLQSGERQDEAHVRFVEEALHRIKKESDGRLGITLSLGEQSRQAYERWFAAGAHRYLLRIETSNPSLYRRLHPRPGDHDFQKRLECLVHLREAGYQVGTGVMIGLPGQSLADLADDVLFFKRMDVDMIGMGPYLPHPDTPLSAELAGFSERKQAQLELGLRMIAVCRLALVDVNIAATTALQALLPTGRELGLLAGANIVMPNITDTRYRSLYQLYDGKPCLDENADACQSCLRRRIESIGEVVALNEWGDSPHFQKKKIGASH